MKIIAKVVVLVVLFQVTLFGALPPSPTGLSVVDTTDRNITLSWNADTTLGWVGYKIYSVYKTTYTYIDTVSVINTPQYTVTAIPTGGTPLTADTAYEFAVTTLYEGRDFVVEESEYSQSVVASTTPKLPITVNTNSGSDIDGNLATCTLAEAIRSANTDTAVDGCTAGYGSDTIVFDFDQSVPIVLDTTFNYENGLPNIDSNITLNGNPTTIEIDVLAGDLRIFYISDAGTLTLNDMILQQGRGFGGGGAISNYGQLTLNDSTLQNNQAIVAESFINYALGGAIVNIGGEAFINNSMILNNFSDSTASASYGGGIYNLDGNLTIKNSTIDGNTADAGGGIFSNTGKIVITDSTISSNTANGNSYGGGGLMLAQDEAFIANSIFHANDTELGVGGAILVLESSLVLENSTISENSTLAPSPGEPGAGIYIAPAGSANIKNVTISDNYGQADGLGVYNDGTLSLTNSIMANSFSAKPADGIFVLVKDDVDGIAPAKSIANLIERDVSSDWGVTCTNCILNVDPMLNATLADNGGPTLTRALMKGSPAIDAGNLTECPIYTLAPLERKDQRYVTRDEQCDIGAYEYQKGSVQINPAVIMYLLN